MWKLAANSNDITIIEAMLKPEHLKSQDAVIDYFQAAVAEDMAKHRVEQAQVGGLPSCILLSRYAHLLLVLYIYIYIHIYMTGSFFLHIHIYIDIDIHNILVSYYIYIYIYDWFFLFV